jgi:hypothetical protein
VNSYRPRVHATASSELTALNVCGSFPFALTMIPIGDAPVTSKSTLFVGWFRVCNTGGCVLMLRLSVALLRSYEGRLVVKVVVAARRHRLSAVSLP